MRILLVRPPLPPYTVGLRHVMTCEPLELEYVAAGLNGHEVQIFDMLLERGLGRKLRRFQPDVVGTSSYITGVNEVKKVCRTVKAWRPSTLTVVGGVHASTVPDDFADHSIDAIVLGDGCSIMGELLEAFQEGRGLPTVAGLALPVDDERVVYTSHRPYMPHPDRLPLPRRDLVGHLRNKYYYLYHRPVALLKTTWGCWYRCDFCFTWHITGGRVFSRSPESIVEELSSIEAEDVYIVDDIFLIDRVRLERIGQLMREREIRKRFLCFGRSDFIAENEDLIAQWAQLGLSAVLVGLEAATDVELRSMNKRSTVERNRRAVDVLRRNGIDTYGSLIPGVDYSPAEWERLWNLIEEAGLYYLNISPLTPYPGTKTWTELGDAVTVPRAAHPLWDLSHVLLPTRVQLQDYYRALLRTYFRAIVNPRRARSLTHRAFPPIWSRAQWSLWWGVLRIYLQLRTAHRHHRPAELARAMDKGPPVPGLQGRPRSYEGTTPHRPSPTDPPRLATLERTSHGGAAR